MKGFPDRVLVRSDLDTNIDQNSGGRQYSCLANDCDAPMEIWYKRGTGVLALRCSHCKKLSYEIAVAALAVDAESWVPQEKR